MWRLTLMTADHPLQKTNREVGQRGTDGTNGSCHCRTIEH